MLVKNLEHLKELSSNKKGDMEDYYVLLAGGLSRIWKRIFYDKKYDEFSIVNEIDESYQEFNSSEIGKKLIY